MMNANATDGIICMTTLSGAMLSIPVVVSTS